MNLPGTAAGVGATGHCEPAHTRVAAATSLSCAFELQERPGVLSNPATRSRYRVVIR